MTGANWRRATLNLKKVPVHRKRVLRVVELTVRSECRRGHGKSDSLFH